MTTPFVTWEGTYALGMVEIDEQHRTLFEIMNKMWQAIVRNEEVSVGSRTIGYLKTSVRCCMAERYFEKFWQHGKPVPRSCHADQSS